MPEAARALGASSAPRLTVLPGRRAAPLVREMRRDDLPEAAAMFADVMRSTPPGSDARLAAFFERTLFDHPWADPEIPSYVAEDVDGSIIGMVGTQTRRLRMGDRDLRLSCPGFFVVAPRARRGAVGLELARRVMGGPQDASVSDSASVVVERLFAPRFGGRVIELSGVHWVRAWRPSSVIDGLLPGASARLQAVAPTRLLARGIDRAAALATGPLLAPAPVDTVAETLTPELLLEHLDAVTHGPGPHVAYDEAWLRWLFGRLGDATDRGLPVRHLVRDADGRALGWYVYYLRPGGRSEVMQLKARRREMGAVLDHLLRHAWEHGSAMLRGRLEPGLTSLVSRRRCMLWYRGGALAHSPDPAVADALVRHGTLTRLDNEWFSDCLV